MKILQISDIHLKADPGQTAFGAYPEQSLQDVLRHMQQHHFPADMMLVTGDLTHDGDEIAYRRLAGYLNALNTPVYCLPGNHDDPALMKKVLCMEHVQMPGRIDAGGWQIILLDSMAPGRKEGVLSEQELNRLAESLELYPDRHALIGLHHHPVPIGSRWMDTMILENPEALFRVLDDYPQVRGVVWGHVHQAFDRERQGVRLLGAPATCVQFRPLSVEFCLDDVPVGYRWLELGEHGEINTGIARVG